MQESTKFHTKKQKKIQYFFNILIIKDFTNAFFFGEKKQKKRAIDFLSIDRPFFYIVIRVCLRTRTDLSTAMCCMFYERRHDSLA